MKTTHVHFDRMRDLPCSLSFRCAAGAGVITAIPGVGECSFP